MATSTASADLVPDFRDDLAAIGRWALLGAAAGALAGGLIGGVGGRLAMFVLRLTSSDAVRGVESDDGFMIGRFSLDTGFLLAVTAMLGAAGGLLYVATRSFIPERVRVGGWAVAGGLLGGSLIIRPDGVDFNLLDPLSLAVALFVLIPAAGAGATAALVERWSGTWWWRDRRRTVIAAVPAVVALLFPPLLLATLAGVLLVFLAGRSSAIRRLACAGTMTVAGAIVLAAVVVVGGLALLSDVRQVFG